MAFDEQLAERARTVLREHGGYAEKKMFGGLCFLINGNMVGGVLNDDLIVRMDNEEYDKALKTDHCRPMDLTGMPMTGIAMISSEGVANDNDLRHWLDLCLDFVESMPAK